jgi:hypothetical protein
MHHADASLERANRPVSPPLIHTGEVDLRSVADWKNRWWAGLHITNGVASRVISLFVSIWQMDDSHATF